MPSSFRNGDGSIGGARQLRDKERTSAPANRALNFMYAREIRKIQAKSGHAGLARIANLEQLSKLRLPDSSNGKP